jgi:hypothetical protein
VQSSRLYLCAPRGFEDFWRGATSSVQPPGGCGKGGTVLTTPGCLERHGLVIREPVACEFPTGEDGFDSPKR